MIKTIIIAAALAASLGAGSSVHAAQLDRDLPILVDMHYELKNPSGPVELQAVPDALKEPPEYRTAPQYEIDDIPHPNFEQQLVLF